MSSSEINSEADARADMKSDKVGGIVNLDQYRGTNLMLDRFKITRVLDDIIMVQYADTEDGEDIMRGGIFIPTKAIQKNQVWRVGKIILAGPRCTVKEGEFVIFPGDKGIQVAQMGELKNLIFLNEDRIFGVVQAYE